MIFLTVSQLCERWQLSRRTVCDLLDQRQVPHYRIGKSIRVALADAERYEQQSRIEAINRPIQLRRRRA